MSGTELLKLLDHIVETVRTARNDRDGWVVTVADALDELELAIIRARQKVARH